VNEEPQKIVVILAPKSVGLAIILTFLLGPLGMLYATILGGVVMFFANLLIGIPTLGFGLIFTWPIGIIWAALAADSHNKKLLGKSLG